MFHTPSSAYHLTSRSGADSYPLSHRVRQHIIVRALARPIVGPLSFVTNLTYLQSQLPPVFSDLHPITTSEVYGAGATPGSARVFAERAVLCLSPTAFQLSH